MNIFFKRFPVQFKFKFAHNIDPVSYVSSYAINMLLPSASWKITRLDTYVRNFLYFLYNVRDISSDSVLTGLKSTK